MADPAHRCFGEPDSLSSTGAGSPVKHFQKRPNQRSRSCFTEKDQAYSPAAGVAAGPPGFPKGSARPRAARGPMHSLAAEEQGADVYRAGDRDKRPRGHHRGLLEITESCWTEDKPRRKHETLWTVDRAGLLYNLFYFYSNSNKTEFSRFFTVLLCSAKSWLLNTSDASSELWPARGPACSTRYVQTPSVRADTPVRDILWHGSGPRDCLSRQVCQLAVKHHSSLLSNSSSDGCSQPFSKPDIYSTSFLWV